MQIKPSHFKPLLRPRPRDSHKGDYGHLLIVGGSVNRLGAPLLAARAALRTGAGLVSLALPDRCYQKIPRALLEVMYEPLPSNAVGRLTAKAIQPLRALLKGKGAVAIGPGLGVTPEITKVVVAVVKNSLVPVILDADALNALSSKLEILRQSKHPVILTHHPGEMGRLIGTSAAKVQKNRLAIASDFARRFRCLLVLKGDRTIIAMPNGDSFINPTGNPGMATAGMGDLLTGMVGALVTANPGRILEAVLAAVYIHGSAGDRVRTRLGDRGLLASDVIEEIPLVFKELVEGGR